MLCLPPLHLLAVTRQPTELRKLGHRCAVCLALDDPTLAANVRSLQALRCPLLIKRVIYAEQPTAFKPGPAREGFNRDMTVATVETRNLRRSIHFEYHSDGASEGQTANERMDNVQTQ